MVTKEEVENIIRGIVDEDFVKSIEVDEKGNVTVTLAKDTPNIDDVLIKLNTELGKIEGVGTITINREREKKTEENVELNKDVILEKLKEVIDPEIGVDIVNLGLIYELDIRPDNTVYVKMTMTTPGCPLTMWILRAVEDKILEIPGVKDAEIELTFDPPWSPEMISEEYKKRLGLF
ncbi:metal-sulfur cluster assembly factor [Thermococcus thioreducens]|uniref:Metal-sulfur cluster biosynthetic enzyme n=1 Tax=Thermococcus thioreducens TaxID=277988 RepID=A0A0Q2ULH6_9EURY|nr:metal-sulfur cluster assembly factor [Thermococcus thioreducens]ASJ13177.1 ring hydroxylating protein [Thermococcus thioreducens]KQH81496.1 ring hydroxylating protein [Thermococcus thioreducens]SEW20556.1 Metal-sulfur cluster biosynthetic enzyme [Thermococcus thioreducens]